MRLRSTTHPDRPAHASSTARCTGTNGQAAVEFALVMPLVVIMALGLLVIGVAVRSELAVELAAREGARAAAVSAEPGAAQAAATRAVRVPIDVSVREDGTSVTVSVEYTDPVDVPIIGRLIGPLTHTARATMAIEPP